jgi:hypothetical protein
MGTFGAAAVYPTEGWLRSRAFDLWFCGGIAVLALVAGAVLAVQPQFFLFILLFDYWVLSYHHVIATFTRLCFDAESFRAHRFLVLYLPALVLAGILVLTIALGPWAVVTVYFYAQWWHTMRQSYGIAQAYRRKAGGLVQEYPPLAQAGLYLMPLWGILHRSHQQPQTLLMLDVRFPAVPKALVDVVALVTLAYFAWWLLGRLVAWREGRLPLAHTLYVLSHWTIFYVAYVLIEDVSHGLVVGNIWHTAQYLMFVWMFNANRFRGGVDPKARLLSALSQPRNALGYFLLCLTISTSVYLALAGLVSSFQNHAVLAAVLVYQAINFHHFIVDAIIWKTRGRSAPAPA